VTDVRSRVLHVAQPSRGGVAKVVEDAALYQSAHGCEVIIASPEPDGLAVPSEVRAVTWAASREPGHVVLDEIHSLKRIIERTKPDLVHLHSSKAGLVGRLAIRRALTTIFQPHGWSFHALEGRMLRLALHWERWASRWADATICVSSQEREVGDLIGVRRSVVIPNGVDLQYLKGTDDVARVTLRRRLAIDAAAPVVLCLGRFHTAKGQDLLLEAWPRIQEAVSDARLLLVGDSSGEPAWQQRATEMPSVICVGHQDDVRPWLSVADLVVIPSRWEGLSLTMLEAMAVGRSVISTDVAGARDVLRSSDIVPTRSVPALVAATVDRLRSREVIEVTAQQNALAARSAHDRDRVGAMVLDAYAAANRRRGLGGDGTVPGLATAGRGRLRASRENRLDGRVAQPPYGAGREGRPSHDSRLVCR
jgi:glycosyltransferase involved in cell wall biosynthesis